MRRSRVRFSLWPPAPYWLGRCQFREIKRERERWREIKRDRVGEREGEREEKTDSGSKHMEGKKKKWKQGPRSIKRKMGSLVAFLFRLLLTVLSCAQTGESRYARYQFSELRVPLYLSLGLLYTIFFWYIGSERIASHYVKPLYDIPFVFLSVTKICMVPIGILHFSLSGSYLCWAYDALYKFFQKKEILIQIKQGSEKGYENLDLK